MPFVQWVKAKYSDKTLIEKHDWIKVHLMCGVITNIVTSVEVREPNVNDCPQFAGLVKATGRNFTMAQVSADKAYLSSDNMQVVADHNARPFIAFKANSTTSKNHSAIWKSNVSLLLLQSKAIHGLLPQAVKRRNNLPHDQD